MAVSVFHILPLNLKMKFRYRKKESSTTGCLGAIYAKMFARGTNSAKDIKSRYSIHIPTCSLWIKKTGKKLLKKSFKRSSEKARSNEQSITDYNAISVF